MKHVALDYHFIRNLVQSGRLRVVHVSTKDQLADMIDITQITLRSELLSQIRGSDVVLRDRIYRDSRITQ